ncbi:MAG: helicase C-terminal domain-containing protein [Spirochaetaceae bacterium]
MKASERIDEEVLEVMREAVAEAGGNEVLFVCDVDEDARVCRIEVKARGNLESVPAPDLHMRRGKVVVHNHPGGRLDPSRADLEVASGLAAEGIGSFIVDNEAENLYVVVEPFLGAGTEPIDAGELTELIEAGGALARLHSSFEPRPPQIEMLEHVVDALNEGRLCVAEAGTGVGKSLAYLLPAFRWAERNEERVAVSTATINLQQQIVDKDIPLVRRLLDSDIEAVLVKGRGNYLCLNRLEEAVEEDSTLFSEPSSELVAIRDWAQTSVDGSRSDMPFYPSDELWSRVNSDPDACGGMRCRNREGCFVMKARRRAARARVLVVNHHLLFSDLALRLRGLGFHNTAVLPPVHRLVFDEAHSLEDSATSYFSESFSQLSVAKYANRLLRERRGRRTGLLVRLESLGCDRTALADAVESVSSVREQAETLNGVLIDALGGRQSLWIKGTPPEDLDEQAREELRELQNRVIGLGEKIRRILSSLPEASQEEPVVYDVRMTLRRLEDISALCEGVRDAEARPDRVYWIERRLLTGGRTLARLVSTPVDVSDVMQEAVYEPYGTVIFTSATLSVNGTFGFWKQRIGLDAADPARLVETILPSPFDFKNRVLLGVPEDAPLPDSPEYQAFLSRFVIEALTLSEGRALVLFTSYEMLTATYEAVRPALVELGITSFRQGQDERSRLLTGFNSDTASVLFATQSFWQGVDAPGETLTLLVLCKLPFRVPTHPIQRARMEAVKRENGNPFRDLSLPDAVTRLKQGFGRLMRHRTDRGVVLLTDARVVKKSYGRVFFNSLPETARSVKEASRLLQDVEDFLYGDEAR